MAAAHTPYHSQSTHGGVISTTAGMAIQNLERSFLAKNPDYFTASPLSPDQLTRLGLNDYFDEAGNIIFDRLPAIYRTSGVEIRGSRQLSQGSLQGLLRLLELEEDPASPSENFKSFAIGVFLQCEAWDCKEAIH
jgi:hypothetical protein